MTARLESSAPAPTDRERIWAAIREFARAGKDFTRLEIALATRLPSRGSAMSDYLKGLERAGFVGVVSEKKRGVSHLYTLLRDAGVDAPRVNKAGGILQPSGRSRMWKTMRILGTFSARELASAASLKDAPVAVAEAEYYCNWLCRGGYLRSNGGTASTSRRWTFLAAMNTGPKAPQILRVKKLYDPNRDAVVCESELKGGDDL